ncbi:uncharacterized protein B0T15DRAFT_534337 [Chaetomium strumarium]|uniref:Zn(2)-C6 fungal-type domain-containing protein n=1 Tax=Chaetomium strumarium TaxID=1170767 RepID=A0AAJ0GTX0_9PEZI|nr:hypothetical protein B0T15DRAFT_534337 [Chaetomium strumarium]
MELSCSSCNRTFPSVSALERHRLRCRFRPSSRRKACAECSRSKVRCDQARPSCSRCVVHGLVCVYPNSNSEGLRSTPNHQVAVPSASHAVTLPLTPSSDLSQPQSQQPEWRPLSQGDPLADPSACLSVPTWLPAEWQTDLLPFLDEGYSSYSTELSLGGRMTPRLDGNAHLASRPKPSPFEDLSLFLGEKWKTAQQGLDFIDSVLNANVDNFVTGLRKPLFIHFRDWDMSQRPAALVEAVTVGQLYMYAIQTGQSDVVLRALDAQLAQIQLKVSKMQTAREDVEMLQAVLQYASMRVYRAGPIASECVDPISLRLMQHVLSKSLGSMSPPTSPTPSGPSPSAWQSWILDESIRRALHHRPRAQLRHQRPPKLPHGPAAAAAAHLGGAHGRRVGGAVPRLGRKVLWWSC